MEITGFSKNLLFTIFTLLQSKKFFKKLKVE